MHLNKIPYRIAFMDYLDFQNGDPFRRTHIPRQMDEKLHRAAGKLQKWRGKVFGTEKARLKREKSRKAKKNKNENGKSQGSTEIVVSENEKPKDGGE